MAATKTAKSLDLTCPCCGDSESAITLNLNDMTECYCNNCGAEFSPARAVQLIGEQLERWQAVVAWIESAPVK